MELFWAKGYEATSLDDLLGAMKIGRQSLYDTFGDKRALFLASLAHYRELTDTFIRTCLGDAPDVKTALRRLFMQVIDEPRHHRRRGCLLVNTAVELAPHDASAARIVAANQRATEKLILAALEIGRARGEIAKGRDLRALARYLVSSLQGLRVTAKANPKPAELRDIVDVTLAALG